MLGTLYVARSLALVDLGGSDPTGGFHLRTLSIGSPSAIVGPVLHTVAISCDVMGTSYEESGWCIKSFLLCLFTAPVKPCRFASSVVTPWGL
jgi:hypothetical protein